MTTISTTELIIIAAAIFVLPAERGENIAVYFLFTFANGRRTGNVRKSENCACRVKEKRVCPTGTVVMAFRTAAAAGHVPVPLLLQVHARLLINTSGLTRGGSAGHTMTPTTPSPPRPDVAAFWTGKGRGRRSRYVAAETSNAVGEGGREGGLVLRA